MNEFPVCGCEEYKKYLAEQALGAMIAFSWLCKNEDALKAVAIEPNHAVYTGPIWAEKKEEQKTMDKFIVSCRGFTGELTHMDRKELPLCFAGGSGYVYDLSIEDSKEKVTHSFTGVKLSEIKFLGGEVSFG